MHIWGGGSGELNLCCSRHETLRQAYTQFRNKHNTNISLMWTDRHVKTRYNSNFEAMPSSHLFWRKLEAVVSPLNTAILSRIDRLAPASKNLRPPLNEVKLVGTITLNKYHDIALLSPVFLTLGTALVVIYLLIL